MNQKQLLEIISALKHEILNLLINQNIADDEAAQQTLNVINEMFSRLNLEIDDVIPREVLETYFDGVDEATKLMKDAGIDPVNGIASSITSNGKVKSAFQTRVHLEAIAEITDNTILDLKAAIRTARTNAVGSIERALSDVKKELQGGVIHGRTRDVITQRVAESFAKEGMTSFVTVDGKKLPLDFYSEVVTRTNLKKANTDGALNRYTENGIRYVTVTGGTPTCHECAAYRDIVFSLVEGDSNFPYLPPNTFPLHPNCQCSLRPYVITYKNQKEIDAAKKKAAAFDPNKDTRSKAQKGAYEKQQSLHRRSNAEKKQFMEWNATLGAENYKTLGAFRRAKRSNSVRFQELQSEFRSRRLTKSVK